MSNSHPKSPSISSVASKLGKLKLDDNMSTTGSSSGDHRRSVSIDHGRSKPKVEVEAFYGDRSQLRRFLVQLKAYFALEGDKYPSSRSEILFAGMQLKSATFGWFEPYMSNFLDDEPNEETKKIFGSFMVFENKIRQVFNMSDEERVAITKIRQLKQRGSAAQYYANFQSLAMHLEWDDNAKASAFYDGLSDVVKDQMMPEPLDTL